MCSLFFATRINLNFRKNLLSRRRRLSLNLGNNGQVLITKQIEFYRQIAYIIKSLLFEYFYIRISMNKHVLPNL